MTKRTQRRRPKKRRSDFLLKNKLLLLILGVAGLLVFSMVFFARMEEQPSAPTPKPVAKPQVDPLKKVHAEVEAFLAALNVSGNDIQRDLSYEPARYMLEDAFPAPELVDGFKTRIQRQSSNLFHDSVRKEQNYQGTSNMYNIIPQNGVYITL